MTVVGQSEVDKLLALFDLSTYDSLKDSDIFSNKSLQPRIDFLITGSRFYPSFFSRFSLQ